MMGAPTVMIEKIPEGGEKVADVILRTQEGFARGQAIIQGSGAFQGSQLIIEFQNENLVALLDGEAVLP
jgi:uncharacterized protein